MSKKEPFIWNIEMADGSGKVDLLIEEGKPFFQCQAIEQTKQTEEK